MFTSSQTIVYLSDGNRKCFAKLSNFKKNFRKKHLEISKLQRAANIFIGISRLTNTLVVMPINCAAYGKHFIDTWVEREGYASFW